MMQAIFRGRFNRGLSGIFDCVRLSCGNGSGLRLALSLGLASSSRGGHGLRGYLVILIFCLSVAVVGSAGTARADDPLPKSAKECIAACVKNFADACAVQPERQYMTPNMCNPSTAAFYCSIDQCKR